MDFIIIFVANASVMSSVCKSRISMKQLGLRQTRSARAIIEPYLKYAQKYLILLDGIMRFLLYLDHGCGFYLYTFTGELFRREMKKFIYACLFVIFRRRMFSWSSAESRRHSELSCSNGGGGASAGASYVFCSAHQHGQFQLHDSVSSNHGRYAAMNSSSRAKFSPSIVMSINDFTASNRSGQTTQFVLFRVPV
jgi:hypothetical protein